MCQRSFHYIAFFLLVCSCFCSDSFLTYYEYPIRKLLENNLVNAEILNVKCFWIRGTNVYTLQRLQLPESDWNYTTAKEETLYFNFCENTKKPCGLTENSKSSFIAYAKDGKCIRLSGDMDDGLNAWNYLDKEDLEAGITLNLSPGDACKDGNYTITYKFHCNKTMEKGKITFNNLDAVNSEHCSHTIEAHTAESTHNFFICLGCPYINYYIITNFLLKYYSFLGGIIIAIGVFLVVFGAKFLKITVFIVGTTITAGILLFVYFNIFHSESTLSVWIVLVVGLVLGLFLSWLLMKAAKAFFVILGGALGYLIGLFLYNLVLKYIHSNPQVVYWVTIAACVVTCALLSLWLVKHVLIFSTSICGGYAIIRGASLYFGGFPSESEILDLVQHKEWRQLEEFMTGYVYIYLAVWLLFAVTGLIIQYKMNPEKKDDDYKRITDSS